MFLGLAVNLDYQFDWLWLRKVKPNDLEIEYFDYLKFLFHQVTFYDYSSILVWDLLRGRQLLLGLFSAY